MSNNIIDIITIATTIPNKQITSNLRFQVVWVGQPKQARIVLLVGRGDLCGHHWGRRCVGVGATSSAPQAGIVHLLDGGVLGVLRPQQVLESEGLLLGRVLGGLRGDLLRREPGGQVGKRARRGHHQALRPHALDDLGDQFCARRWLSHGTLPLLL